MWISYSDSEVRRFHPICEKALNRAIKSLKMDNKYEVIHHQYTGSLEMDFVIKNKSTGKYACVVEVKRTPADVNSARYQYQAMSYVQMNSGITEKPFYIITNLEYAYLLRYDPSKEKVFQQILKPGLCKVALFKDATEEEFIDLLTDFYIEKLQSFFNDSYDYLITFDEFANIATTVKEKHKEWKSSLALMLYEYIRGSFDFIRRNDLHDIRVFNNNISRICNEASRVNFKDIFSYDSDNFAPDVQIPNNVLIDLYELGKTNINGDTIADILHQIVSTGHEHYGEVPTDLELGRLVSVLAKSMTDKNDNIICDPAAGSGNLISSAIDIFSLKPNQIIVNDVNIKLLELLSLRLGLKYANIINKENSPKIYNRNIANFEREFFNTIDIILMNPPFVAGINCVDRKNILYSAIEEIKGSRAILNVGQMSLEGVFLELINTLVSTGTIIACVFPKTHLMARGEEAKAIRKYLLNNFGLKKVFMYPGQEIFNGVMMDTCVLVGSSKQENNEIEIISSYDNIPDIDIHLFENVLKNEFDNEFKSYMPGIMCKKVTKDELDGSIDDGWRQLNSEMIESIEYVKENIETSDKLELFEESNTTFRRGQAGNSGGSDLLFIDSRDDFWNSVSNLDINTSIGIRNAFMDNYEITNGDSKFYNISNNEPQITSEIVKLYLSLPAREGRQQRTQKSYEELMAILNSESRNAVSANSVLIPRAIRKSGKVYLTNEASFVSTNFVVCSMQNYNSALVLSSWMTTIFYQLLCEVSSKDQEGMRKMEVNDIKKTFVPKMNRIESKMIEEIYSEKSKIEFLDLKNPQVRNIDIIWAKYLFGKEYESKLDEALRLLEFLANRRNS